MARCGQAWQRKARLRSARQGLAWSGSAWLGKVSREKSLLYIQSSQIILRAWQGLATRGAATRGAATRGAAVHGSARLQGEIPALCSKVGIMKYYTEARQGRARRGNARCGMARQGQQELRSCFIFNFHKSITNYTRRGLVWHGNVRRCMVRQGSAWQGHRASKPCALCVNK